MKESEFEIKAIAYLKEEISKEDKHEFEVFLNANPAYQEEFDLLAASWRQLAKMESPEPSENMDSLFFEMLNSEIEKGKKKTNGWSGLQALVFNVLRPQLAYGVLLLFIGLGVGYFMKQDDTFQAIEPQSVSSEENQEIHEKLVLTLLEQPSANKRLEGVSEANKISTVDETVINALLKTLNNDANVNVRLASIESLTNYVGNPKVRQGLIQSIPHQKSPIVQVTLANLMLALEEKKSIEPFKQLLKNKELDSTVKKKIESTIASII